MTERTMTKIAYNEVINNKWTVIGWYTYRFNPWTGDIYRCPTGATSESWIDSDGNTRSAWIKVANIND